MPRKQTKRESIPRITKIEALTEQEYQAFAAKVEQYVANNMAYFVGQNLVLTLHREREANRTAIIHGRKPASSSGLASFYNRITNASASVARDVILLEALRDERVGQSVHAVKGNYLSENQKPKTDKLYPWMAVAFFSYESLGREIAEVVARSNPTTLRGNLLERFRQDVENDIIK